MAQTFKVRCSREYAAYFFVEAETAEQAEEYAEIRWGECTPEDEASHIHDRYEVEEV